MKKIYYILGIALITVVTSCSTSRNYAQAGYYDSYQGGATYQQFYDELSPYGSWISYPGYGYVWSPYDAGFAPYSTNGYWVYSTFGWTWVSNYRWGWAPFHYGRWFLDVRFGWLWVPGYEWAPAWVAWRGGGSYYGWAPLGPGMSISVSIGMIPNNYWYFVPGRYITHRNISNYYVRNNTTVINNTTIINNNYYTNNNTVNYNAGPRIREVERVTNTRIAPVRVIEKPAPGNSEIKKDELAIYRPQVRQVSDNARPAKVVTEPVRDQNGQNAPARTITGNNGKSNSGFQSNGIDQTRPVERVVGGNERITTASPAIKNSEVNKTSPNNGPVRATPTTPVQRPLQTETNSTVVPGPNRRGSEVQPQQTSPRVEPRTQTQTQTQIIQRPQTQQAPRVQSQAPTPRVQTRAPAQATQRPQASRVQPQAPAQRIQPASGGGSVKQSPERNSNNSGSRSSVRRF